MGWGGLLFGFRGRTNRAVYWLMVLAYFVVLLLGFIGIARLGNPDSASLSPGRQILFLGIWIVVFASALAVGAKRLHDRDKAAWWLLLFYVVPGVLLGIGIAVDVTNDIADHCFLNSWAAYSGRTCSTPWTAVASCLIGLAIGIWAFAELFCLRGTIGTNRYGPEPLSTQDPEDVEGGDGNGRECRSKRSAQ
jgi:uncharacterized membrane protein YhaH (DUF805 family)